MLKFDLAIKKKNKIQKLHLNFEIRLKQRSKFEFYFLFFEKLKIEKQIQSVYRKYNSFFNSKTKRVLKIFNPCTIRGSKGTFDFCFKMKLNFDFLYVSVFIFKSKNEFQIRVAIVNKIWKINFMFVFFEIFSLPECLSDQSRHLNYP